MIRTGKTLRYHLASGVGMLLFVIFAAGSLPNSSPPGPGVTPSAAPSEPKQLTPKELALAAVKLDYKWRKEGFGNVMEADFTLQNRATVAVKDIEIRCEHYAPSGTKIDRNTRTIYETLKPGERRTSQVQYGPHPLAGQVHGL
jgi:hypothetical protein